MARLAIAEACLTEYAKLDKHVQRAVDQAITTFARHPQGPVRRAAGAGRRRPWNRRLVTVILPTDALSPCAGYRQYRG